MNWFNKLLYDPEQILAKKLPHRGGVKLVESSRRQKLEIAND